MKSTLLTAALLTLAGCSESDDGHDHGHDHDHGHGHGGDHDAAPAAKTPPAPPPEAAAPPKQGPVEASLGAHTAQLQPTADGLRLTVTGADGAAIQPVGEAKVVLTGTDEEPQRLVLKPDGAGWSGAAKAEGAKGYVAVVSLKVGDHTETARASWGEVPAPASAPSAKKDGDHGHGEEQGGHDHAGHDHKHH